MVTELLDVAQEQQGYVEEIRHELHKHPETRWEGNWTHDFLKRQIDDFTLGDDKWSFMELEGGLVFDYTIKPGAERRLFRAEMDALPVHEKTGLSYASQRHGKMHACGHDANSAMLLGAMRAIAAGNAEPTANLRLVFQEAEENPGEEPIAMSGGETLVQEGVLDGCDSAHALHIWVLDKPGVFSSMPGEVMGNSGRIRMDINIEGGGGHACMPNMGSNVLRITQAIQSRMDTFAAMNQSPFNPVALVPVILNAGSASNVMPATGVLWYACRTMLPRDQHFALMDEIEAEVKGVVGGYSNATVRVTKIGGHPALINDDADYRRVHDLLDEAGETVKVAQPALGGEDFTHFLHKVRGSYWYLGANQEGSGNHHAPTFNPDEKVFHKGVHFWLELATAP